MTQQTRRKLEEAARETGVTLLQIYDQDWFALRLYRESVWCKRLLQVIGRPHALSPFPITTRPVLGDQVLGREREMRLLLARRGDCLLSGAPGSGKTFLLRALVLQGQGLFMVDDDREQVANDLRELSPRAVIIDDAHVDPGKVERFVQIRREVGSDVRVIATRSLVSCNSHSRNNPAAGHPAWRRRSSTEEESVEADLMEQGADDYIRKPIDPRRFLARVKAVLRRAGG